MGDRVRSFELGTGDRRRRWQIRLSPDSPYADLQDESDYTTWNVACEGETYRFSSLEIAVEAVERIMEAHRQRNPDDGDLYPDVVAALGFHVLGVKR